MNTEFPNKLKTDLEAQRKAAASAELALSKAIAGAKLGSEPLYQPKVEQVQKCSNLIDERVNLVEDDEGDEDQLKTRTNSKPPWPI